MENNNQVQDITENNTQKESNFDNQSNNQNNNDSSDQKKSRFVEGEEIELIRVRFPGNAKSQPFLLGKRNFIYAQKVVAMSDDGIIEAIEHTDQNIYISAFQFHPEMMVEHELACHQIFSNFVEAAVVASNC